MVDVPIIKLQASVSDPRGRLIPRGVQETLTVQIADQVATFYFKDGRTTERFAKTAIELERRRGANDTVFIKRTQKAITKYEGKTKEEIRDIILQQLKQMGVNARAR